MNKIFLILMLLFTSMFAKSYHFKELRYSDGLDRSISLSGEISFLSEGLSIKYDESKRSLRYEDERLELFDDGELVAIGEEESLKIIQYFELIIILNAGDEKSLASAFEISKEQMIETLVPKDELKNYIKKIQLQRENAELKKIKLYLSNEDTISISIEDEIR